EFLQAQLWPSTLPLADDVAGLRHRVPLATAVRALAPLGERCGSPNGVPIGAAEPGGAVERLDPWDPAHPLPALPALGAGAAAAPAGLAQRLGGDDTGDPDDATPQPDALARIAARVSAAPAGSVIELGELAALARERDAPARIALAARLARRRRLALLAWAER